MPESWAAASPQWAATAGHTVELCDVRTEAVTEAVDFVRGMLDRAVEKGRTSSADAQAVLERLVPLDSPAAVGEESAANWSSRQCARTWRPRRRCSANWPGYCPRRRSSPPTPPPCRSPRSLRAWPTRPARRAPLLQPRAADEDRGGRRPALPPRPEIPAALTEFVEGCGHRAVTVADTPGFLVNHAGRGLVTEAFALLEESVADPGRPRPRSPATYSACAWARSSSWTSPASTSPRPSSRPSGAASATPTGCAPRTSTAEPRRRRAARPQDGTRVLPLRARRARRRRRTRRPAHRRGPLASGDRGGGTGTERGSCAGCSASNGSRETGSSDLLLVATWGGTVSAAVAEHGLPAQNVLGVDPLSLETGRRVLAVTPADRARGRTGRRGRSRGSLPWRSASYGTRAGSVAQRLLASIVSVRVVHRGAPHRHSRRHRPRRHGRTRLPPRTARLGRAGSARRTCSAFSGDCTPRPATPATGRHAGSPNAPSSASR